MVGNLTCDMGVPGCVGEEQRPPAGPGVRVPQDAAGAAGLHLLQPHQPPTGAGNPPPPPFLPYTTDPSFRAPPAARSSEQTLILFVVFKP